MARVPNRTLRPTAGGLFGGSRAPARDAGGPFRRGRVPVGFGAKGNPFFSLQQYMNHHGGRPPAAPPGTFTQGGNPPRLGGGHLPDRLHQGVGGPPIGGHPIHPQPPFSGPGHPQPIGPAQPGGYQGLAGIIAALQHGLNQTQFNNMAGGATGTQGTGIIGGVHGAFSGLSPAAVHYLATSGLLTANTPTLQDTSGLQGDDLFKAQLMNNLLSGNAQQNPTYSLHSGIDANYLGQLLSNLPGAYAKGFNATGRIAGPITG